MLCHVIHLANRNEPIHFGISARHVKEPTRATEINTKIVHQIS